MPKYPTDPEVRAEILRLRSELKLTNKGLAQTLLIEGVNETFLSKYANDNLDRLVENFEARFRDTVKSLRERIAFGSEIFETSVTRRLRNGLDLVRRTGDIALFTSPAGNGKTSGIRAYCRDNPSAVHITLNATTRGANKVESLVFATIDAASWKSNSPRFDYLTVLGEEFGETCEAALHSRFGGPKATSLREEAVQLAAVALAIVECLDRGKWTWTKGKKPLRFLEWRDLECDNAPTFAGYLMGQPETSLFMLTEVGAGEWLLQGAFIRDEDDGDCHPSREAAETAAYRHLEAWMTRNA